MKRGLILLCIFGAIIPGISQDWKGLGIPADPGVGFRWELQDAVSDDFNYDAPADNKGDTFNTRWTDFYHNAWTGPGLTVWDREHSLVKDGLLQIPASRLEGTNKVSTGCITSAQTVIYPAYIEANVKIANSTLASDVWMLSPDDTQEIDICEAYGTSYSEGTGTSQTWFADRIHISHHVFIRSPFQDYQPTDAGTWYYNGTLWRLAYHRCGVYWKDPWNLEYYIDGNLVRTVSGESIIDPLNYTGGTGLNKAMDIIINMEDQDWRSDQGLTPTDSELEKTDDHTFKVDWIRVYKPVIQNSLDQNESTGLHMYPMPFTNNLNIQSDQQIKKILIYNLWGEKIYESILESVFSCEINGSSFPPGMYIVQTILNDETTLCKKILKQYAH